MKKDKIETEHVCKPKDESILKIFESKIEEKYIKLNQETKTVEE